MPVSRKEKKPKKHGDRRRSAGQSDESPQDASLPITAPATPRSMPPPPSSSTSQPGFYRVAIPRLHRDSEIQSIAALVGGDFNRVAHACESCRHRKTKCSGEHPKCKHCEDFKLQCVYVDGKRDRARKELGSMAEKLDEYEKLLKEISPHMDSTFKQRITSALEGEVYPADGVWSESPGTASTQSVLRGRNMSEYDGLQGEHRANARAGSTDSVDIITEDFNRDAASRAAGYYGKNSEITWMQRLRQETEQREEGKQTEDSDIASVALGDSTSQEARGLSLTPIHGSTYHCDDLPISIANLHVDPYAQPPENIADRLFQTYLDTVHPTFPILGRTTFTSQYKEYFANQVVPNDNWLAILNIILAIGAKYAHQIRAEWAGDCEDHLIYFTRARMLGFNTDSVLKHAELQRVQISGLMAFYLMATNQINRSWAISGIALRHATTLGLNLLNRSKAIKTFSREIRYRVWWALCYLERQLAVMTGRTPSIVEAHCTCPLPLPVEESGIVDNATLKNFSRQNSGRSDSLNTNPSSVQSHGMVNSPVDSHSSASIPVSHVEGLLPSVGLYFLHYTKLSILTNHVLSRLYRAGAMERSWSETQSTMAELNIALENWRQQLPLMFDFTKQTRDQQWIRQRKSLGFSYYSTIMVINRPCLCRMDRRIANESGKAQKFDQVTAARCVHAAIDMLDLLPDVPNPALMYAQCPWWCLVHHLVEAAVVCMLELSFRATHMPDEVDEVFESAVKAVRWLSSFAVSDLAATRAWQMCDEMLRKISPRVGKSTSEMPSFHSQQQQPATGPIQGMQQSFDVQTAARIPEISPWQALAHFQNPMLASYDQNVSNTRFTSEVMPHSTENPYANMFPSASEMDAMGLGGSSAEGYMPPPDPWYSLRDHRGG